MDSIKRLYECCKLRGNPPELIHRTMNSFNLFLQSSIFGKISSYKMERDMYLWINKKEWYDEVDTENWLDRIIELFHKWCIHIYMNNPKLLEIYMEDYEQQGGKLPYE